MPAFKPALLSLAAAVAAAHSVAAFTAALKKPIRAWPDGPAQQIFNAFS